MWPQNLKAGRDEKLTLCGLYNFYFTGGFQQTSQTSSAYAPARHTVPIILNQKISCPPNSKKGVGLPVPDLCNRMESEKGIYIPAMQRYTSTAKQ